MENYIKDFAHEELLRFQNRTQDNRDIKLSNNTILTKDQYLLDIDKKGGHIIASNARGLLYGVYQYAKDYLGFDFSKIGQEILKEPHIKMNNTHAPRVIRRGNIFEVINDTDYLLKQIDMNAKHGHNEMFFTFFLFDEVKDTVVDALMKRGMEVTLGGHSLKYLLEPILSLEKDETANLSFYKDETLMNYIVDRVVAVCKANPIVTRISLWPQDIGIPESKGQEFMQLYINFNHRIKRALIEAGLEVAVEFIVYNAGLNWEMLSYYEDLQLYDDLDILYAFWGRNYGRDFDDPRALDALKSWLKVANVTVLEYYSDFFMMSELYPPLGYRINQDINFYESLGVQGILNLVVPLLNSKTSNQYKDTYDYQSYHQQNNIIYSECLWQTRSIEASNLEKLMAPLTEFNRVYFPERLVDRALDDDQVARLKQILSELGASEYHQKLAEVIKVILGE